MTSCCARPGPPVLATVQKCAYSLKSAGPSATRCRTGAPGVATRQAASRLLRFRYGPSGDEPQPQAQWAFQGRKETSGHGGRIREINEYAVVKRHIYFQHIDAVFDRHLHRLARPGKIAAGDRCLPARVAETLAPRGSCAGRPPGCAGPSVHLRTAGRVARRPIAASHGVHDLLHRQRGGTVITAVVLVVFAPGRRHAIGAVLVGREGTPGCSMWRRQGSRSGGESPADSDPTACRGRFSVTFEEAAV